MSYFCSVCAQIMSQVVNQQTFQYVCSFHQNITKMPENSILYSSEQQKQESLKKTVFNENLNQLLDDICVKCGHSKYVINTLQKNIFTCVCEQQVSKQIDKSLFKPGKSLLSKQIQQQEQNVNTFFHISQRQKQNQVKQLQQQ